MKHSQFVSREALRSTGFLAVNKRLVAALGPELAIYISHLADKHEYFQARNMLQADGSFFVTVEDLIQSTAMSDHNIRRCKEWCEKRGIITVIRRGVPAKNYFIVDFEKVWEIINSNGSQICESSRSGSANPTAQDMDKCEHSLRETKGMRSDVSNQHNPRLRRRQESQPKKSDPVQVVLEHWNSSAEQSGLPKAITLTDARRTKLRARIEEFGLKEVRRAIRAIHRSSFCRGENDRGWKANIDFITRSEPIAKALEGFYDDRKPTARRNGRGIISHDPLTGSSTREDGEPVNPNRWSRRLTLTKDKDVWQGPKGRLVICKGYPDPHNNGNLIPDAQPITQDQLNAIMKQTKEMRTCH